MVLAFAGFLKHVAARFDPNTLVGGRKTEPSSDAVLEHFEMLVLELDDLLAIRANQVVVMRMIDEIRVVAFLVAAQIDLAQQTAFDQQTQGSVERGPRSRGVDLARQFPELLSREMLLRAERRLDDHVTLRRSPQALELQESIDFLADGRIHRDSLGLMSVRVQFSVICFCSILAAVLGPASAAESETRQLVRPVLIRNDHNTLLRLTIRSDEAFARLETIVVEFEGAENLESAQFFFANENGDFSSERRFGERLPAAAVVEFRGHARLDNKENHFWLSCRAKPEADLTARVDARVARVETSAGASVPRDLTPEVSKRIGVALRRHWDDGVHTYRIPVLATSAKGTLLSAYDMRRRAGRDLQEDMDIGLIRSEDGGQTWGPQQVIMDMGEHNGKPQELNGVSDPGIVVDPETGEIFCIAVWMQGKPEKHQWVGDGSEPGHEIGKSAQILMVRSTDDGLTWSEPENMTSAWKDSSWILYAPSPQQGIALSDGTLVMPMQGRDAEDRRFSNLLVSRDHGKTWTVSKPASFENNECQAALLSDGSIMLNCRSLTTKFRTVMITRDLGETWTEHPTNRNTLIEPICNGSLYRFGDLLLFANPHSQTGRTHHSIQVSKDDGASWPIRQLLDEGRGAGYPSLSRIDDEHVGIVYEGSGAHVVFEKIPISELLD